MTSPRPIGDEPKISRLALAAAACLLTAAPLQAALALDAPPPEVGAAAFDWFAYQGQDPSDHAFKPGSGQYANPILKGTYPDPSVVRVGGDYYLVNSTFGWFPGIPVFHSTDLVHWTQIANAIDRPGMLDFKRLGLSQAVFAPAITAHQGTFYILNTCVGCGGNYLITTKDPHGPWSDPVWLPQVTGIDPSLFFDDDGSAWIVNNDAPPAPPQYSGHRAIWLQQYDPEGGKTVGPRSVLVDKGVDPSTKPSWIEGPHLLKKDGWYYLTCAEGGTGPGHSQVVLRARTVKGPYAPYPGNPILTQRDLPKDRPMPIIAAGHADLVDTPDGQWWATFLGVRPYAGGFDSTGRETFLLPVTWKDGWPVILEPGQAIPYVEAAPDLPRSARAAPTSGAFAVRDEFDGDALRLDWVTMRTPKSRWWNLKNGALLLTARDQKLGARAQPSFWGRRQQHMIATVSTAMRFVPVKPGDKAGLAAVQNDERYFFLGVTRDATGQAKIVVEQRASAADPVDGVRLASAPIKLLQGQTVYLRIEAKGGLYDFAYATRPGGWRTLKADADGTILSSASAKGFIGTLLGVYAYRAP
jgi:alpha-N-arabinofuranosidase